MWADTEEARSDFILAAAMAIFGPLLYFFVLRLVPLGPLGMLGHVFQALLVFAVSGLVPLLLARYRAQGLEAFGLDVEPRDGIIAGILIAGPLVALGVAIQWLGPGGLRASAIVGVLATLGGPLEAIVSLVGLVMVFAGVFLLYTFLAAKARSAFARNEITQLEALRTFGIATAGLAVIVGLLVATQGRIGGIRILLDPLILVVLILLADRLLDPAAMTTRATVLAPAIVALIVQIELFGGQFLVTARHALLGTGLVIVLTILIESRRYAWAALPALAAVTIWPTPFAPFLRFGAGI